MERYRGRNPSTATTSPNPSNEPTPAVASTRRPTRYKVEHSVYKKKTSGSFSVKAEFRKYALAETSSAETDILRFWEVRFHGPMGHGAATHLIHEQANRTEFPTLFAIAMDYLPIQATSVPCERVFSSAKETDTAKRNRTSPVLMEALQLLKFSLRGERLSFTNGWLTSEERLKAAAPPTHSLLDFLSAVDVDAAMDNILNDFNTYDREC